MNTRQEKALEIRDLIKQVNARVAELKEDGCTIEFVGAGMHTHRRHIQGRITDVIIERISKL